jgi:hypothetical protein
MTARGDRMISTLANGTTSDRRNRGTEAPVRVK